MLKIGKSLWKHISITKDEIKEMRDELQAAPWKLWKLAAVGLAVVSGILVFNLKVEADQKKPSVAEQLPEPFKKPVRPCTDHETTIKELRSEVFNERAGLAGYVMTAAALGMYMRGKRRQEAAERVNQLADFAMDAVARGRALQKKEDQEAARPLPPDPSFHL